MLYFIAITIQILVVSLSIRDFHVIGDTIFAFGGDCGCMFGIVNAHMSVKLMFFFFFAGSSTLLWEWALCYVALLSLVALQLNLLMAAAFVLYPT